GAPQIAKYPEAENAIRKWQTEYVPRATIILLDQPTIVENAAGQRPVEKIVGSLVSRRHGGMQPANTSKGKMFGKEAPVWPFLAQFGGPADPLKPVAGTRAFETSPVLAMIALDWMQPKSRRLPAEKDVLDLGLEARLRTGVRRVPRPRTHGPCSVD